MCLAIPGQILEIPEGQTDLALADVSGVRRTVNIGLLVEDGLSVGEWVLIHVGFAMSKIDEAEARSSLEFLEQMGKAFLDELDAMQDSQVE